MKVKPKTPGETQDSCPRRQDVTACVKVETLQTAGPARHPEDRLAVVHVGRGEMFAFYERLHRKAPGSENSTRKALAML